MTFFGGGCRDIALGLLDEALVALEASFASSAVVISSRVVSRDCHSECQYDHALFRLVLNATTYVGSPKTLVLCHP